MSGKLVLHAEFADGQDVEITRLGDGSLGSICQDITQLHTGKRFYQAGMRPKRALNFTLTPIITINHGENMTRLLKLTIVGAIFISILLLSLALFFLASSIKAGLTQYTQSQGAQSSNLQYNYWEDPLLERRTIQSVSIINTESSARIIAQLLYLEAKSSGEAINLFLRSEGGSRGDWMTISQTMRLMKSPVNVIAMGRVNSAGVYILASATGRRIALSTTIIGVHMVFKKESGEDGEYSDAAKNARFIVDFWKEYSKLPDKFFPKQLGDKFDRQFSLTADEAKNYGIVDDVIDIHDRVKLNALLTATD